jgi:hypothetical protein
MWPAPPARWPILVPAGCTARGETGLRLRRNTISREAEIWCEPARSVDAQTFQIRRGVSAAGEKCGKSGGVARRWCSRHHDSWRQLAAAGGGVQSYPDLAGPPHRPAASPTIRSNRPHPWPGLAWGVARGRGRSRGARGATCTFGYSEYPAIWPFRVG